MLIPSPAEGGKIEDRESARAHLRYLFYRLLYTPEGDYQIDPHEIAEKFKEEMPEILELAQWTALNGRRVRQEADVVYADLLVDAHTRYVDEIWQSQMMMHVKVQKVLYKAITQKGETIRAREYVSISELIGKMLPGYFAPKQMNIDVSGGVINITPQDKEKVQKALADVRQFEQALLVEGEIVEDDDSEDR